MQPKRRTVMIGLGSGIAGMIGVTTLSQNSKAATLEVSDISVQNHVEDVSNSVNRVDLSINGNYEYQTDVVPDSIVLRLSAKRGETYTQIDFIEETNLTESYSSEFNLTGNLLDLELVAHDDVNPANVGESKELNLDAKVELDIRNNGREIHHEEVIDSFTITINKTTATVESSITGSGNVTVQTD